MTTLTVFETIKKDREGKEWWSARELAKVLEYDTYRNFTLVLKKAQKSCKNSGQSIKNHFVEFDNMVELGSNASRELSDVQLSRYACYLVMQNADPSKEVVALGQTYFAIQTRRQEIQDQLAEDHKRVSLRGDLTYRNKHLTQTARRAGVADFAMFNNYGYRGLYGGLDSQQIHKLKKLKKSQHILDHMGGEELAANIFRASQAEARLRRENITGQAQADQTHFEVGKVVRQTIKQLGGTMPEKLPTPDSVTQAKRRLTRNSKVNQQIKMVGSQTL